MRTLLVILLLILSGLQYRLWVGEGSYAEVVQLQQAIIEKKRELDELQRENKELLAEIEDLKRGLAAVEERARTELGMIREGETYFLIATPDKRHDSP